MKIAVIVVGSHYSGKSKTINKYVKAILGMSRYGHKFSLGGLTGKVLSQSREEALVMLGFIRSQSFEETKRPIVQLRKLIAQLSKFDLLVLAARPSNETPSFLRLLTSLLRKAGYRVHIVNVKRKQPESFYKKRASMVVNHLRGVV